MVLFVSYFVKYMITFLYGFTFRKYDFRGQLSATFKSRGRPIGKCGVDSDIRLEQNVRALIGNLKCWHMV